jgi:hypothetical protein
MFYLLKASRKASKFTHSPIQCLNDAVSVSIKRPSREVDHLSPPNAEVKNGWSYIPTSSWWAGIAQSV